MNKWEEITGDFDLTHLNKIKSMLNEMVKGSTFYRSKDVDIKHFWYADQTYYFIKDLKNQFYYIITWYKSGEIGCILFQGEIIDKNEFDYFYYFLRKEYGKWILEKDVKK